MKKNYLYVLLAASLTPHPAPMNYRKMYPPQTE